jgi:hypothetical protein
MPSKPCLDKFQVRVLAQAAPSSSHGIIWCDPVVFHQIIVLKYDLLQEEAQCTRRPGQAQTLLRLYSSKIVYSATTLVKNNMNEGTLSTPVQGVPKYNDQWANCAELFASNNPGKSSGCFGLQEKTKSSHFLFTVCIYHCIQAKPAGFRKTYAIPDICHIYMHTYVIHFSHRFTNSLSTLTHSTY